MLKNYFYSAARSLRRDGFYSVVNVCGLAIGIACTLLIMLWVGDESSYDRFHPKANRLYHVWVNSAFDGGIQSWGWSPFPVYASLKNGYPNITNSCVSTSPGTHLLVAGETRLNRFGQYASEEFLEMFEFPLAEGDPSLVLDEPYSIVITEHLAVALFGERDAIGQEIRIDNGNDLRVTGILKNLPSNSTFQFDYLLPWKLWELMDKEARQKTTDWTNCA